MKAVRVHEFGGPEVLKYEDVADVQAGAGEVVVKVKAVGVNPVETYIRSGIYGPKTFPYTPGTDAAGTVAMAGAGVTHVKAGDRVYTTGSISGTYAEMVLCKASQVHKLSDKATFQQGAAIGVPAGTAHRALFHRGMARPGETVLIHGATGGVGMSAVQLAHAFGCVVFGTGGSEEGRKLVLKEGAEQVFDHHAADYLEKIKAATNGKGVGLIVEMAAHVNLGKDLTILAKYGRVVVVGSRGPVEINPRETMGRDADIRGMTLMNLTEEEGRGVYMALNAALEAGTLRPVISDEIPLAKAADAHREVMSGESRGKVVMVV